jgi:acetylornithine deacetylase/succinyl-diaminopimelate desuccinylase-like protein
LVLGSVRQGVNSSLRPYHPAATALQVALGQPVRAHLPTIAGEPHPTGSSPAQARVRDYLVHQLTALSLETQVQRTVGPAPALGPGRTVEVDNVVARLRGSASTGAVLVLSHYDSVPGGPGAADNGSGVAALMESMRALAAGPQPRNDVIALFDDGEELFFVGSQAFVAEHP